VKDLQSSDGKGRKWNTNHTDCQAGTIWRCDLDGKNLELLAHNFRNEYEPCVDSFGNIFVSDNDDDGNQQTRICYIMPGGNYGYWPRGPGESHWHEEQPGVVPKIMRTYFGAPTGMCVYEGTLLPKKYWGQPLHTDAGPRHVRCYHLTPEGAGFAVNREDMVTSTDNWFRPSDICVAPDGSVFVADWYDPGVGGHGMGDTTRGRIYRLAPKNNKPSALKIELQEDRGLLAALASPALSVRYMATAKLQKLKPEKVRALLTPIVHMHDNPALTARALWLLAKFGEVTADDFSEYVLSDSVDTRLRVLGVRILREVYRTFPTNTWPSTGYSMLNHHASDLCREDLLSLRDIDAEQAKFPIYYLMDKYDGKDRFYLEAIGIAVGHDPKRREFILSDFDKKFPDWNDKVANLIWELRPPHVLPRLEARLLDSHVPVAQRGQIVDILAGSPDVAAGKLLLKALQSPGSQDIRERLIANLKQFLPAKWRSLRSSPELEQTMERLLDQAEYRSAGLMLIAAASDVKSIPRVRAIATNDKQPLKDRIEAARTLGQIPVLEAVKALTTLVATSDSAVAREAIDAMGMQIPAWQETRVSRAALQELRQLLLDKQLDPNLRATVESTLANTRPGASWLLDLQGKKLLPDALKGDVARLLRNTPYQDLRNRALIAFPTVARLDPKKLPSIAVLAQRRGDAERGKQLLAASLKNDLQCMKCHTLHGVGGKVGPDLSAIGSKASRDNLFESILLPSKAIADQYVTWVIETKRGLIFTGLLIEETPDHLLLRDANARDTKIDKQDVETRAKSPNSLMPNDLAAYLTEEELVDLVEYLFTLKTPPQGR
jgi:putative heme-binding domain-containing protein